MTEDNRVIRFDWAIKNVLRDKANFDILEGFLSALLKEDIEVLDLLESESDQENGKQKYNRVDILVRDTRNRVMIIEIQNEHESDYIERLLFGTCKVIVDHMQIGRPYEEITKVISVSILYFNLGSGDDYVYYGSTQFTGLHTGNPLSIRRRFMTPQGRYVLRERDLEKEIFPEYYMIHTERFQDKVKEDLDEWIYMLKNEHVPEEFRSRNIDKAREKLAVLKMSGEKRKQYDRYLMSVPIERDVLETAKAKGHMEGYDKGHKKGRDEGRDEGRKQTAQNLLAMGVLTAEQIAQSTGLSIEEVQDMNRLST
ncbi:MAG: Rpn family recombination-promoting nuclease/putative transposase [Desulfobacterales bacterium]|nr:Rpn family recombination-promoting nuclease/putative transposase [Desulfobacterales bacterium]